MNRQFDLEILPAIKAPVQPVAKVRTVEQAVLEQEAKGNWVPACGGSETPFKTRNGYTLLYCWNTGSGRHAYLDCGTDMILSDAEATMAMGMQ